MAREYTPGPWFADSDSVFHKDGVIARIPEVDENRRNWSTNARLIAAAPDLVKALSNVKPLVEWARDHIDPMFAKKAQANVDQIERALAKALGQEER